MESLDLVGGWVQVGIRNDGKVVWVNRDGVCVLRICALEGIKVNDAREGGKQAMTSSEPGKNASPVEIPYGGQGRPKAGAVLIFTPPGSDTVSLNVHGARGKCYVAAVLTPADSRTMARTLTEAAEKAEGQPTHPPSPEEIAKFIVTLTPKQADLLFCAMDHGAEDLIFDLAALQAGVTEGDAAFLGEGSRELWIAAGGISGPRQEETAAEHGSEPVPPKKNPT